LKWAVVGFALVGLGILLGWVLSMLAQGILRWMGYVVIYAILPRNQRSEPLVALTPTVIVEGSTQSLLSQAVTLPSRGVRRLLH
jgi:hypothetical protein